MTVKIPQDNSPVECMYLSMVDVLHTSSPLVGHGWFLEIQRVFQAYCMCHQVHSQDHHLTHIRTNGVSTRHDHHR